MSDTELVHDGSPKMDWQQVALNSTYGPPCFAVNTPNDIPNQYCGRAESWAGHPEHHPYVSLEDLLARPITVNVEQVITEVMQNFRCFGKRAGVTGNPIQEWTKDEPPQFALGVDIGDVVRLILARAGGDALTIKNATLRALVADFAHPVKVCKNYPQCQNDGLILIRDQDGEQDAEQCQFCYTEPLSLFNLQNRAREFLGDQL